MRIKSDERYILNLVSLILNTEYNCQHKFDGLVGDKGKNGKTRKLPVDGYFPKCNLIVEYLEKQHFKPVKIMDKRMTVSGVTRDKQREKYLERRREFAFRNSYNFLELSYRDFEHLKNGKLKRLKDADEAVIKKKLKELNSE